jgi:hypothetical protein
MVVEVGQQLPGDFLGEAGLAGAGRSDEGHQPGVRPKQCGP